jgi:hypothetical protein
MQNAQCAMEFCSWHGGCYFGKANGGKAAFERAQSALGTPATPASNAREARFGDWYFTGDYPTPGGYRVLRRSLENHLARREGRSY